MLNLKEKGLPDAIMVNGKAFFLNTDYRVWLNYPDRIKGMGDDYSLYKNLFKGDAPFPEQAVITELDRFFYEKKEVPRSGGSNGEELIDFDIDADYIYASFMQAYGIDLIDSDMHWHKFSALLNALPGDTVMAQIMGFRGYSGSDKEINKNKARWALPLKISDEERAAMEEFNALFG